MKETQQPDCPNISHLAIGQQYVVAGLARDALQAASVERNDDRSHLDILFGLPNPTETVQSARGALIAKIAELSGQCAIMNTEMSEHA